MKVRGIFDSSQPSRKQKPQPDRILTEAKLALAVPTGGTIFRPNAQRESIVAQGRRDAHRDCAKLQRLAYDDQSLGGVAFIQ